MTYLGEEGSGCRNSQCKGPEVLVYLGAWGAWGDWQGGITAPLTSPAPGP